MKIALTGGAYEARSLIASAQRCLNLFPEPVPQGQGEPMPMAHYPTPGLNLLGTIGTGPIRGIHQGTQGNLFVVSGDNLYHVDTTAWTGTSLGTLTQGLKTPVSMSDNGNELVVVDGTANGWVVELPTLNFQSIVQQNTQTPIPTSTTAPIEAGTALYSPFTAQWNGQIGSATITLDTGYTGNLQCGVFASAGGVPTDVLGFANVVANPVSGVNQLSFPMSIVLAKGTQYWLGFDSDISDGAWTVGPGMRGATSTTDFASFPEASPDTSMSPSVVVSITISNDPQGVFAGADRVDYLDTYFIFNKPNTPQFYISGSLAVTFDPLDFANKESFSDLLVVAVVAKRLLYLFGRRTTEIWYDAGASGFSTTDPTAAISSFPFAAMQSEVFIDHGIVAKYSPAIYDNMVFWLTRDRQGQGIVLMVAGYETRRVSTFAIEAAIFGYNEIDDAIGFTYQLAGHSCYVLTFPSADKTWVYDISAQLWHEWCWIDANGTEHRHRANCFSTVNNLLVVGDWQNGNLYALDNDVYTDNGQPIKRLRSFPHLLADGRRVFYREFLADVATGNAPQVSVVTPAVSSGFMALPLPSGSLNGAAYAISADGTVTVGFINPTGGDADTPRRACYWLNGAGPVTIGTDGSEAYGVSSDGSVIVGIVQAASLFRWTAAGGFVTFGTGSDTIYAMSADGSRSVGVTLTGSPHGQACYWDSSGTRTNLGYLPGHDTSSANAVSADGSVIVGSSQLFITSSTGRAFRWTAAGGMADLGITGTATSARALGVSGDGNLVVGDYEASPHGNACEWLVPGSMVTIPALISGIGVSENGSTVIASSFLADFDDSYFAYSTAAGITVPTPIALDPANPTTIQGTYPTGVSSNGSPVVGYSFGTNTLPWIYHIAAPVTLPAAVNLISLRWSDDRGHSYGSPVTQSIGALGRYKTSLQWQRLGYARDRIHEISWSVACRTALQGCWLTAEPGDAEQPQGGQGQG